jgi:hypothetical protein
MASQQDFAPLVTNNKKKRGVVQLDHHARLSGPVMMISEKSSFHWPR